MAGGRECSCQEAEPEEVANVMAEDPYLVKFRMEELCNKLRLPADFMESVKKVDSSRSTLQGILSAWVSRNGHKKAKITVLAKSLKEMELNSICEEMLQTFGEETTVVFKKKCPCTRSSQQDELITCVPVQETYSSSNYGTQFPTDSQALEVICEDATQSVSNMSISINARRVGRISEKTVLYVHNLPENGKDWQMVEIIAKAANIQDAFDIQVMRADNGTGWFWGWIGHSKPLRLQMKTILGEPTTLNKRRLIDLLQGTDLCKAFDLKITDNIQGLQ